MSDAEKAWTEHARTLSGYDPDRLYWMRAAFLEGFKRGQRTPCMDQVRGERVEP